MVYIRSLIQLKFLLLLLMNFFLEKTINQLVSVFVKLSLKNTLIPLRKLYHLVIFYFCGCQKFQLFDLFGLLGPKKLFNAVLSI